MKFLLLIIAAVLPLSCRQIPSAGTVADPVIYPQSRMEADYGITDNVVVYTFLPPGYDGNSPDGLCGCVYS